MTTTNGISRVLVTGGAGYIGSVLVPHLLNRGYWVTVIDNLMYGQSPLLHVADHPKLLFARGDARNEELLKEHLPRVDAIIPLAAIVGAPACDRDPLTATSTNVGAIRSLLRLREPTQPIIFPTTNSGYGTKSVLALCTEESPLEPISLYGQLKCEAERALLEDGNTITLRLATVFGVSPRMRTDLLVNHFVWEAVNRGYIIIYEKDFKRNYIHIRDVAECFDHCLLIFNVMKNSCYNVGLDEANYSKEELARKVQMVVPGFNVLFSEFGADVDKRNYIVSNAKLGSFGFKARRSVVQGISELIQAYRMFPAWGANKNA